MLFRSIEAGGKLILPSSIRTVSDGVTKNRLLVSDKSNGITFLVDTGADISVIPHTNNKDVASSFCLYAANGSIIQTFGKKTLKLDFGLRRKFQWTFSVAKVSRPIIGADFLNFYNLLVDLRRKRLVDGETSLEAATTTTIDSAPTLSTIRRGDEFHELLAKFPSITNPSIKTAIREHVVKHHITTRGTPVAERPRRLPPDKYAAAKQEFQRMVEDGICRPSSSQWASPLHLVAKKSQEWRPCGDYRRLNAITIPDRYPIANVEDFTYNLENKKVFTTIDLVRAYHQVPVAEEDVAKTAVITPFGLFEFIYMPFGLRNAAQTFQRYIDIVLRGLDFCFGYLDDILVASNSLEQHKQHLEVLFKRLSEYGIKINPSKCHFAKESVQYLGYTVNSEGIQPLSTKVDAIRNAKRPETIMELRRYLGLLNFYRRFMKNAAEVLLPLNKLIGNSKKNDRTRIQWTQQSEDAFEKSKGLLESTALLSHPILNAPIALCTDASNFAMGAVLEQQQNATWKPLGFFSKKFSNAQRNYSTYDKELQAIYSAIKYFQSRLEGRQFLIKTDHLPLTHAFLQKLSKATPRQARQLAYISQFNAEIMYVKGSLNIVPDALSRLEGIETTALDPEEIAVEQQRDEELKNLLDSTTSSLQLKEFPVDNNHILYCDVSTGTVRPFIPKQLRRRAFDSIHRLSHPGVKASKKLIRKRYVWPQMDKDIAIWTKNCINCQRSKVHRHTVQSPMHFPSTDKRFEHVHIDIVGPLPASQNFRYLFTMIDRFSRWTEAVPTTDTLADTIATAFYTSWIARFGTPRIITSDRGSQFESSLFRSLTKLIGSKNIKTTAYHPASNGMIERWHRTLKTALMCHETMNWIDTLPTVLLGLRTVYKEEMKCSPAEMIYGTSLRLPGDFFVENNAPNDPSIFLEKFKRDIRRLKPTPASHHRTDSIFVHKDLPKCSHVFLRVDSCKKPLQQPYTGPHEVIKRISDRVYTIKKDEKEINVSIERLKPAFILNENLDFLPDNAKLIAPRPLVRKTYSGPKTKKVRFETNA